MNLADVLMYCMLNGYPADEKEKSKEQMLNGHFEFSGIGEPPIRKEEKKETKQSVKDELLELINNTDENKLISLGFKELTEFNTKKRSFSLEALNMKALIETALKLCQKDKELTLEEKLIADGYRVGQLSVNYQKDDIVIREDGNEWRIIVKYKSISIPRTEDYEIIKKAVELVKSM